MVSHSISLMYVFFVLEKTGKDLEQQAWLRPTVQGWTEIEERGDPCIAIGIRRQCDKSQSMMNDAEPRSDGVWFKEDGQFIHAFQHECRCHRRHTIVQLIISS